MHALVTDLGARLTGRVIDKLELVSFAALKTFEITPSELSGKTITAVTRHGKYLDIVIGEGDFEGAIHLVFHLARAGWVQWRPAAPKTRAKPGRGPLAARLLLDDGSGFDLTEYGTKKSLAIYLVSDPLSIEGVARLGPDPLADDFTEADFARILTRAGRAQIKGVLRWQSNIAGIGNAYSDEILHAAKMSPFKPASMPPDEVHHLFEAMQTTMRDAIARDDGLAASELKAEKKSNLQVHGRTGLACPVCGDTVRQVTYADSSLQYCPTCQTGGKPLADRVLSRLLK